MVYLVNICALFLFLSFGRCQIFTNLRFHPQPGMLNTGRDGFLMVTMSNGVDSSICNYKFGEEDANVACASLGYPAQGLSISNPNSPINGPVLIGDFKCTGSEVNLSLCLNSGGTTFGPPCNSHKNDVYLYCLQNKASPQISSITPPTNCSLTNGSFSFLPARSYVNTGYLRFNSSYICNDDFGFTSANAQYLCSMVCSSPVNPMLSMVPGTLPSDATYVRINPTSYASSGVTNCVSAYALALTCGKEPVIIESSPSITCTTQNITATWISDFTPIINPGLLSFPMSCPIPANITSNSMFDAIVFVSFATCIPIITTSSTSIIYSYVLTREYNASGITSLAPRNMTISCIIPRSDSANQNLTFITPAVNPLVATAYIPLAMVFYQDSSFSTTMASPYTIYDNQIMYVKVSLLSTLSTLRLGLVNCKVSTSSTMIGAVDTNSLNVIVNSCPSTNPTYNVLMYPISRKDVGFSFRPYQINQTSQLYVLCETTKCYMDTPDANCLTCSPSGRRKRSPIVTEEVVLGPFFVFRNGPT